MKGYELDLEIKEKILDNEAENMGCEIEDYKKFVAYKKADRFNHIAMSVFGLVLGICLSYLLLIL